MNANSRKLAVSMLALAVQGALAAMPLAARAQGDAGRGNIDQSDQLRRSWARPTPPRTRTSSANTTACTTRAAPSSATSASRAATPSARAPASGAGRSRATTWAPPRASSEAASRTRAIGASASATTSCATPSPTATRPLTRGAWAATASCCRRRFGVINTTTTTTAGAHGHRKGRRRLPTSCSPSGRWTCTRSARTPRSTPATTSTRTGTCKFSYNRLDQSGAKLISAGNRRVRSGGPGGLQLRRRAHRPADDPDQLQDRHLQPGRELDRRQGLRDARATSPRCSTTTTPAGPSPTRTSGARAHPATGTNPGAAFPVDTMSTPPSNQLHQLNLTGGYAMSSATRLAGGLSYSRNTQNESYAGSYTTTPNTMPLLPVDSLDAHGRDRRTPT